MRHVATQHVRKYYPVTMYECEPTGRTIEGHTYEHGQWYIECGGEGHYSNSMKEACEIFGKLVQFAITEGRTAK